MEKDKLTTPAAKEDELETKLSPFAEKLNKLRDSLLMQIAAAREYRELAPLAREDFKVMIRPMGTRMVSRDIIPFSMVQRFFVPTIQKMLENMMRNYPSRTLVVEFWLHPYEIGGRKLHDDFIVQPEIVPVLKKTPKAKIAVVELMKPDEKVAVEVEEQISGPISRSLPPILDPRFVEHRVEVPAENVETISEEVAAEILTEVFAEEAAEGTRHDEDFPPAIPPIPSVSPESLNIAAETDIEATALDALLSYEHRDWKLYSTSPVPKKVQRILEANGIYTLRKLIEVLGTNTPSFHEWSDFVQRINCEVEQIHRLGGGSAQDFLKWMRDKGYIAAQFRTNAHSDLTGGNKI